MSFASPVGGREWADGVGWRSYFNDAARIGAQDYIPSDQDILRSRVKTTGLTEERFYVGLVRLFVALSSPLALVERCRRFGDERRNPSSSCANALSLCSCSMSCSTSEDRGASERSGTSSSSRSPSRPELTPFAGSTALRTSTSSSSSSPFPSTTRPCTRVRSFSSHHERAADASCADSDINRMNEAAGLFESISNSRCAFSLARSPSLFLTSSQAGSPNPPSFSSSTRVRPLPTAKAHHANSRLAADLFKAKLISAPIYEYYSDYEGPSDYPTASEYMSSKLCVAAPSPFLSRG